MLQEATCGVGDEATLTVVIPHLRGPSVQICVVDGG